MPGRSAIPRKNEPNDSFAEQFGWTSGQFNLTYTRKLWLCMLGLGTPATPMHLQVVERHPTGAGGLRPALRCLQPLQELRLFLLSEWQRTHFVQAPVGNRPLRHLCEQLRDDLNSGWAVGGQRPVVATSLQVHVGGGNVVRLLLHIPLHEAWALQVGIWEV